MLGQTALSQVSLLSSQELDGLHLISVCTFTRWLSRTGDRRAPASGEGHAALPSRLAPHAASGCGGAAWAGSSGLPGGSQGQQFPRPPPSPPSQGLPLGSRTHLRGFVPVSPSLVPLPAPPPGMAGSPHPGTSSQVSPAVLSSWPPRPHGRLASLLLPQTGCTPGRGACGHPPQDLAGRNGLPWLLSPQGTGPRGEHAAWATHGVTAGAPGHLLMGPIRAT